MSDTTDPSEEPIGTSGAEPVVPDLVNDGHDGDDTDAAPDAVAAVPAPASDGESTTSRDSQRLMIAVAILVVVAIGAIVIGIARKGSSDSASTKTTSSSSTTTAKGGNAGGGNAGGGNAGGGNAGGGNGAGAGAGCPNGTWPKYYMSKPDAATLKKSGVHVWNESTGWKIRIVDTGGVEYSGDVAATAPVDAKSVKAAGAGAKATAEGNRISFTVTGSADPAGFDFALPCAIDKITITIQSNGTNISPDVITVGKDAHAIGNPIVITKVKAT